MSNYSHILSGILREGQPFNHALTFFDDFLTAGFLANTAGRGGKFDETADSGEWCVTLVDGGGDNAEAIVVEDDARNGILKITNNNADNDVVNAQVNGEAFAMAAGKRIIFEAKFKSADISANDLVIGLCITDPTLCAGMTDGIYFRVPAGDTSQEMQFVTEKDSTETTVSSGVTIADDTWYVLRFEVERTSRVAAFINGTYVGESVTNLPTDEYLTPSFEFRNTNTIANINRLDYIAVVQDR